MCSSPQLHSPAIEALERTGSSYRLAAQTAESELRNVAAKRSIATAASDEREDAGANLSTAFARWTETMQALQVKNSRVALVSQIVTEVQ